MQHGALLCLISLSSLWCNGCILEQPDFDAIAEEIEQSQGGGGAGNLDDAGDDEGGGAGGAGAGGAGAGGADASTPDLTSPTPAQCQEYCDTVANNCTDELSVYRSPESCLGVCSFLPAGDFDAPDWTNTVACRAQNARFAQSTGEPRSHCPAAGPGGNDRGVPTLPNCGSDCEAYCSLHARVCDDVEDETVFEVGECMRRCSGLVDQDTFDAEGDFGGGDTLQCRLAHLSAAAVDPAAVIPHCRHSRLTPEPGSFCTDGDHEPGDCAAYCKLVMVACVEDQAVYESEEQCLDVCDLLEPGTYPDLVENTVGCRRYHAYSALDAPVVHCSHAGPTGDGHCGTENCTSFCRILKQACSDEFIDEYAPDADDADDLGDCPDSCADVDGADGDSDYSVLADATGDTVQCRTFHAIRALAGEETCNAAFGAAPCN